MRIPTASQCLDVNYLSPCGSMVTLHVSPFHCFIGVLGAWGSMKQWNREASEAWLQIAFRAKRNPPADRRARSANGRIVATSSNPAAGRVVTPRTFVWTQTAALSSSVWPLGPTARAVLVRFVARFDTYFAIRRERLGRIHRPGDAHVLGVLGAWLQFAQGKRECFGVGIVDAAT
jgi:hypothetical protein